MLVKKDNIFKIAEKLLEEIRKDYVTKKQFVEDFITNYSKSCKIKTILIVTSDLGHSFNYFVVNTNADNITLGVIDVKYGMKYRHQSTDIKQMKNGAKQEGFIFDIINERFDVIVKDIPKDSIYHCNYGNY